MAVPDDEPQDMSFYPAHMRPLYFPTVFGPAAIATCRRIAAMLGDHLGTRATLVTDARDGWEGAFRQEFDETWSPQSYRVDGLKQDLQTLAGKIETAMSNVATINSQRATMREQYLREQTAPTGGN
ncbi:MAG: hypothetical protein ACRD0U_16675 [Acidimicrobiales bacterium]